MTKIEVVLFDMGGVLVELGSLPELLGTDRSDEVFWPQWLGSEAVQRFERGEGSPEDFAKQAVVDLELTISPDAFLSNFARFPKGLYPGSARLVEETAAVVGTGVLSNTNALHWQTQPDAATISSMFDHSFLSYEIGSVKPEPVIFAHVLSHLGLGGDQVLFIDDNAINVDGARGCGLQAAMAKGPKQARHVLVEAGILEAS